jgi:acyl-CoA reductase-like NAD-dependent aldehyde dehydrogenase
MDLRTQLFIAGQYVDATSGETIPVLNPATGQLIAHVQKASRDDLKQAIAAADLAFKTVWGPLNPYQRSALLHKVGDAIMANQEFLAQVETDDVGKPIFESRNIDVASAAATFHYFADICVEVTGHVQPSPYNDVLDYTIHEPIGVVGAIIPWNFPFLTAARKIASALAAGNTMVIKPASWAPLSTLLFGELFREAGMPAGVLNIVPAGGGDTGTVFAESTTIDEVSFTGSTEVGVALQCLRAAAQGLHPRAGRQEPRHRPAGLRPRGDRGRHPLRRLP